MPKTKTIVCMILILFALVKLSAQGQFVNRPIALGYSYSTVTSNNESYNIDTYGLTLARSIDLYYGSSKIKKKTISMAGTTIFIRKNVQTSIFPAISINMLIANEEVFPGAGLGLFVKVLDIENFRGYIVPNFSVLNDREDWETSGSIFLSLNVKLLEHLNIYLEPEKSFDDAEDFLMEIGLCFEFGKILN